MALDPFFWLSLLEAFPDFQTKFPNGTASKMAHAFSYSDFWKFEFKKNKESHTKGEMNRDTETHVVQPFLIT